MLFKQIENQSTGLILLEKFYSLTEQSITFIAPGNSKVANTI